MTDFGNHAVRVVTLAGTADGAGPDARLNKPCRLALDECGRLLVVEFGRKDSLRVVEASLATPPWVARWGRRRGQQRRKTSTRCFKTTASCWRTATWRTWCLWWKGSAFRRTAACWQRKASTFGSSSSQGCRTGAPRRFATRT